MSIADFITKKLSTVQWTAKQTQLDNVKKDVERLETKVNQLQSELEKEKAPLNKIFEARGK
jgi:hypothetical protein